MKNVKVETFESRYLSDLKTEVNRFIKNKDVLNISFSSNVNGYVNEYYCIVAYSVY